MELVWLICYVGGAPNPSGKSGNSGNGGNSVGVMADVVALYKSGKSGNGGNRGGCYA